MSMSSGRFGTVLACFLAFGAPLPVLAEGPVPAAAEGAAVPAASAEPAPVPASSGASAGEAGAESAGPVSTMELPRDLSPWGMFLAADIVVKLVMIGLALASLATWTIWLAKSLEIAAARRRARKTLAAIAGARGLDEALERNGGRKGPAAAMLEAARAEADLSAEALAEAGGEGLKERIAAALSRIEARAARRIMVGTGVLATVGSVSPFVGLFGTVWGIMNAFIGISKSHMTNLAVVAPGIAEALLATAIGLVAAIPAVVIYNHFARATARYRQMLADAAVGVEILVSRDLDFRSISRAPARPRAVGE